MRIPNFSLLALAALIFLAAGYARAASNVNASYVVSNRDELGIVRAFDDGENTIIVFADVDSQKPVLTDKSGKKVSAKRVGDYLILPGIFDEVQVREGDQHGVVKARITDDNVPPQAPSIAANTPIPTADTTVSSDRSPVQYKPGSAVYPIPFVKSPSSTATIAASASTSNVGTAEVGAVKSNITTVPAATSTATKPNPAPPAASTWSIKRGYSIESQLKALADSVQPKVWYVAWDYPTDIMAGADYTWHGDFPTFAENVIKTLASNGLLIHYRTFEGNNTFRVYGTGARTP